MATSSIFAAATIDDEEAMDILAAHLKAFEEREIPDDALAVPSPCATQEELHEFLKDAEFYDPDTGGFISLDTLDPSDTDDEIHDSEDE
ncbi:MAG: hypothetical protein LUE27_11305 [Clostridia bacterium]|nr:hypothetical protein [Clostridia bacterium]